MVYIQNTKQDVASVSENVADSKLTQEVTVTPDTTTFYDEDMTTFHKEYITTTDHHKILEWLGDHEIITIIFVGMFVVLTLLIAMLYYIYKHRPCCKQCCKEKLNLLPISQVFFSPTNADRMLTERLDSNESIKK